MFRVVGGCATDCSGITRRHFVQAGTLGAFGLGGLLKARARQAPARRADTSVILFWIIDLVERFTVPWHASQRHDFAATA